MTQDSLVLLFIKAPAIGRVKSRLAAAIGPDHALNLYKNFVLDVLDMLDRTRYPVRICFYPAEARPEVTAWLGPERQYLEQNGNDLGERMERAFASVFFAEGCERALILGSDIPDLADGLVREAFVSLETNDAVLGPAADGGYYLIGFNRHSFFPRVFQGMRWSTPSVFHDTTRILRSASCRFHLLSRWQDVDSLADLKSLVERSKRSGFRGSRSMHYLERYGPELFT